MMNTSELCAFKNKLNGLNIELILETHIKIKEGSKLNNVRDLYKKSSKKIDEVQEILSEVLSILLDEEE